MKTKGFENIYYYYILNFIIIIASSVANYCDGIDLSVNCIRDFLLAEHLSGLPYCRMALAGFSQVVIIILFGVIWIGRKIIWTWFHSNKNYQEYTWSFDKSKAPPIDISAASNMGGPWASMPNLACMGQDCCPDGFTYVSSEDRCMPNEEAAALLVAKTDASSGASASRIWGRRRGGVNDLPEVIQGGFGGL